jgi:hypothetical protein
MLIDQHNGTPLILHQDLEILVERGNREPSKGELIELSAFLPVELTRVGKFYEASSGWITTRRQLTEQSYYEAATHLSSILDIKLTHKTQRAKVIDREPSKGELIELSAFLPVDNLGSLGFVRELDIED